MIQIRFSAAANAVAWTRGIGAIGKECDATTCALKSPAGASGGNCPAPLSVSPNVLTQCSSKAHCNLRDDRPLDPRLGVAPMIFILGMTAHLFGKIRPSR